MRLPARFMTTRGFTLVEIAVVVAIIGLLAALAIPAFARAYSRSTTNQCISNLRAIESAKQQWAMEVRKGLGVKPKDADLFGMFAYLRTKPVCPSGGKYGINKIKEPPTCTIAGHSMD